MAMENQTGGAAGIMETIPVGRQGDKNMNKDHKQDQIGQQTATGSVPRILIAEDDAEMRTLLALFLEKAGYDVLACSNGTDLVRYICTLFSPIGREEIALVISDIRMPGFSGLEVLRELHGYMGFPPIILITAFGDETIHAQAKRYGAKAIFDKPFDIDHLLARVREIVPLKT
jgi:two-component system response regulator (stage 0 sporulation protein F)